MIARYLTSWRARLQQRIRTHFTVVRSVRGFRTLVENRLPQIDTAVVLQRLETALGLIEEFQPWRFRHLQRDVLVFWIVRHPTRGRYYPAQRTVLIELTFLSNLTAHADAEIAACIIHEGTHARIAQRHLRPESWNRAREERICRRTEIAFGQALPAGMGARVLERAEGILNATDDEVAPTIDWTEAYLRQHITDIESLALPPWIAHRMIALLRWRARRRQARSG